MYSFDFLALPDKLQVYGNYESKRIYLDAVALNISFSQKVRYYAKQFDWGKHTDGSCQLALALLLRYLPIDIATALHQLFESRFISRWEGSNIDTLLNFRAIVVDLLKCEELLVDTNE